MRIASLLLIVSCQSSDGRATHDPPVETTDDTSPTTTAHAALALETVSYPASAAVIANPERGFYHHTSTPITPFDPLELQQLTQWRSEGETLILRIYDLQGAVSDEIGQPLLDNMEADFQILRDAGAKAVLRFRYTEDSSPPYGDASVDQVFLHVASLTPTLRDNTDVILAVEAGFIGAWGEWYYTDHFGDLGVWDATDTANRDALVTAILEAVPGRAVLLRTPGYRTNLFGEVHACHDGSTLSRLGHHNDCFLASDSDFGTWWDKATQYPWTAADTRCTPMGGETCAVFGERSRCPTALTELEALHWTYLNADYNTDVLDGWEADGCLGEVENRLGYRLVLDEATLPSRSAPGFDVPVSLTLHNEGFAAPINPRGVDLILRKSDGEEWRMALPADPRTWLAEDGAVTVTADFPLHADLAPGTYEWFLHLPDPMPALTADPSFAIRLGNDGLWEENTGYNRLNGTLQILTTP